MIKTKIHGKHIHKTIKTSLSSYKTLKKTQFRGNTHIHRCKHTYTYMQTQTQTHTHTLTPTHTHSCDLLYNVINLLSRWLNRFQVKFPSYGEANLKAKTEFLPAHDEIYLFVQAAFSVHKIRYGIPEASNNLAEIHFLIRNT